MQFIFKLMNKEYAKEMSLWDYKGDFDLYLQPYFDTYNELTKTSKGPGGCDGYAVFLANELIGIFEYYFIDNVITIGLALNPTIVGKGIGGEFVNQGIIFGVKNYNYKENIIKLSVDIKNIRAIKIYERIGFIKTKNIYNDNGLLDSYEMIKYLER